MKGARDSRFAPAVPLLFLLAAALAPSACAGPAVSGKAFSEAEIMMKRGDGYYFNGRYEEALAEYGKAIDLNPRLAPAHRSRALAFSSLGKLEEAKRDLDRAIAIDGKYADAYLSRGSLSFRQGRFSDAIDDFDRVIELDPWNSTAQYYKALACEKVGRLREAVEAYKGYIHCSVPRDDDTVEKARERIRALESGPLP